MPYSISTLLTRNLHDVFGENDPARRRAAIDEIFTEDCVFHEPRGIYRGRDEIDRIAGAIKATHPDFRYQPIAEPEELGNGGRVQWVSGRPDEAPAYAGTDFIIARDGRIAALLSLFRQAAVRGIWPPDGIFVLGLRPSRQNYAVPAEASSVSVVGSLPPVRIVTCSRAVPPSSRRTRGVPRRTVSRFRPHLL
jgi:hypothetical protein